MAWKSVILGDHCTITSSKRFHASERTTTGVPFYCSKEIIQKVHGEDVTECDYISDEAYENVKIEYGVPETGDLLITSRGTYGVPYLYRNSDKFYFADGNLTWLKDFDEELDAKYFFYWVQSYEGQQKIDAIAKGTAQKAIPISTLKTVELTIPDSTTQKKIASILSAYEDLIENNQKQIKLLEEAAQRLYKEWFVDLRFPGHENVKIVDGVPEGWERCPIYDIAEYINGYAFKPCDWQDKGKPIIKIKEMNEGITKDTPRNIGEKIPDKYNIVAGDILFSWSATLSAMIWDLEDGILNQHIFKVIPKEDVCREYVLQSILQTLTEFNNLTTGATMKHIQRGKLKEVFVKLPCKKIMEKYRDIAEIQREAIISLRKKNAFLQEARDRLLPKLISGEIQV